MPTSCARCRNENPDGARFCNGCGSRLALACPRCGRPVTDGSGTCAACGLPLPDNGGNAASPLSPAAQAANTDFVGRETELADLRSAMDEALAGHGSVALLAGDPGIGKTRTANELAAYAVSRGATVLWGRCYESDGAPPYWPWVQAIRAYCRDRDPDTLRAEMGPGASEVAAIVPELRSDDPGTELAQTLDDSDQGRFRLFDSVASFLISASRSQPILLVMDNLHGADKPSLLLLEFLAQELAQSRLMVLGTYRDIEVNRKHPLFDTLGQLAREPRFRRISLKGLDSANVRTYIERTTGVSPMKELVDAVLERTEGNPLFVTEVVRLLVQEGRLKSASSASSLVAQASVRANDLSASIPEGIKETIGRRLNRLSEGCVQTLVFASVLGREFGLNELEALVDHRPVDRLLETLEEAIAARIIEEVPKVLERYQFSHVLIRETLYDDLSASKRARIHGRVGEILEEIYSADLGPYLAQLSHHFLQSAQVGGAEQAVEYSIRAAERDMSMLAYEEAVRYYESAIQAMRLMSPLDNAKQTDVLLAMGDAHTKAGDTDQAMDAYRTAANVARAQDLHEQFARAAIGFEDASWRPGMYGGAAAVLLEEALLRIPDEDSAIRTMLLGAVGRALVFSGSVERAEQFSRRAAQMARRLADPALLMTVLMKGMADRIRPELLEERVAAQKELLGIAQRAGRENSDTLSARSWAVFDQLSLGDMEGLSKNMDGLQQGGIRLRQPFFVYVASAMSAIIAMADGNLDDIEAMVTETYHLGQKVRGHDAAGVLGVHMFTLRRLQGRIQELATAVKAFTGAGSSHAPWRPGLALIYAELDMRQEAEVEFERIVSTEAVDLPLDSMWIICMSYLSEVCSYLGDKDRAKLLYRHLMPYSKLNIVTGGGVAYLGAAARYLGLLAATQEQWDVAEEHFECALEMETRCSTRSWRAYALCDYGRTLLLRSEAGDATKAKALLEESLALASSAGMTALKDRAGDLLRQSETKVGERLLSHSYPDDLSGREVEVLRLISSGKSNRDIAADLFISTNTVANHVKNILSKTGTANRTEAAAYALRRDLA